MTLVTRRAGLTAEHGVRWESTGEGSYTVEAVEKATRGTDVILHLRPDEDDLLSGHRLREILRKYSDHIAVPILMKQERWDSDAKKQVATDEDEQVNRASALWARPKSEISEEQYHELYKHVAHDVDAAARLHARQGGGAAGVHAAPLRAGAGAVRLVGSRAPPRRQALRAPGVHHGRRRAADAGLPAFRPRRGGLERSAAQRVPRDPAAVQGRGGDPVGRDQAGAGACSSSWPRRTRPSTQTFWKTFGRVLKEGIPEDHANRDRLAKLLRFSSTHHEDDEQTVSLADYVGRMKDGQTAIYYITADGYAAARHSPHLEIFRKLGVEVLLLHERIDEWVASSLHEFDGKPLQSAAAKDLDLSAIGGEAPTPEDATPSGEHAPLLERMQTALADRASAVRVDDAADRIAGVPRQQPGRPQHQSGTADEGGRPGDAGGEADPRGERRASAGASARRRERPGPVQRLEPDPVRSGHARGRRADRGSGGVRQAAE